MKKPIRSLEEWLASFREWEAAQICSDQSDDKEERFRATQAQIEEEKRWEECEHLFIFDDEGDCRGINPKLCHRTGNGNLILLEE